MKKTFLFLFLISGFVGFSQVEDAWVYFKDKPNSQTYFSSPLLMLTQRALDRRSTQTIALDSKDIPVEQSYINDIKAVVGITVMAKSKWLNSIHIRGTQALINSLKTKLFVNQVDFANKTLNQTGKKAQLTETKKVNKTLETQIVYPYGTSANQIQMLNGHLLHQQNYTGTGKIIAVLDAGFPGVNTLQPFQKLITNNQILGGYDFVSRNSNFYTGGSHGTSVLSTMGGYTGNNLVGTAPEAKYYLFITEDVPNENPVEESLWVEAAERADSLGVDIINSSLGYFEFDNTAYNHTYSEMNGLTTFISRGAEIAFSRGMIVVSSAGNSGGSINPHIAAPADAVNVLAIGAVKADETYAAFSSIGPSFDGRIKPDIMAQGNPAIVSNEFGNIVSGNGTSYSSPIMAGMLACLWQAFPSKTNIQIRQLILESADRFTNPNAQFGYGIPDFSLALSNGLSVDSFSKNDIVIYPNPTEDIISVTFPEGLDKGTISIYTVLGQKVLERKITTQSPTISMKSLSNGVYLYKMESEGFSKSGKIVKQ